MTEKSIAGNSMSTASRTFPLKTTNDFYQSLSYLNRVISLILPLLKLRQKFEGLSLYLRLLIVNSYIADKCFKSG